MLRDLGSRSPLLVLPLLGVAAGCGGAMAPAGNPASSSPALGVAEGIHACQFVAGGVAYGPHRCNVTSGNPVRIDKVTGFERFAGTLTPVSGGLALAAEMGCEQLATACRLPISVLLHQDADGTWRGPVEAKGGPSDWFLAGATFELLGPEQGGGAYGGGAYGGGAYGGGAYGGAR